MTMTIRTTVAAFVLLIAATPCFALWGIAEVTKEDAKKLGLEVRSKAAGPKDVRVEVEFKVEGPLKNFSHVDLRIGDDVIAALKEDRSKEARVVVSFVASRASLEKVRVWVMVPESLGGTAFEVRMKDFVEVKEAP